MSWQLLIILSVILTSFSSLIERILLKDGKSDPLTYSVVFQLITGVIIGIFGYLFSNMIFSGISKLLPNLILMIILYGVGNLALFNSLKLIEASRFVVIFAARALFTLMASAIFLGERLVLLQLGGVALIILSVLIVTIRSGKELNLLKHFGKGELYALMAALCFGLANTNDRFILKDWAVYPYVFSAFVLPAVAVVLVKPKILSNLRQLMTKSFMSKMLLLCILYGIGAVTFFSSLDMSPSSSQVATINLTGVVLTVLLSIFILKEKERIPAKILGAVLSFVGLLLLS